MPACSAVQKDEKHDNGKIPAHRHDPKVSLVGHGWWQLQQQSPLIDSSYSYGPKITQHKMVACDELSGSTTAVCFGWNSKSVDRISIPSFLHPNWPVLCRNPRMVGTRRLYVWGAVQYLLSV